MITRMVGFGATALAAGLAVWTVVGTAQTLGTDTPVAGQLGRVCSLASLQGDYGFVLSGLRPGLNGQLEQFVGVALVSYDGRGGYTQVDNVHGPSGAITDRTASGTYTVEPDCSTTSKLFAPGLPAPIETRGVIVDKGAEVRSAVMAPAPIIVTSVGRKVF